MDFILEEIDIKDEEETEDIDTDYLDTDDLDPGSVNQSVDWKLNPNVECRVMLERSLQAEKELQRYSDENGDKITETSSGQNESVDKSCGVYRKLKLLVDVLKNCEKRDKCGLCEKYIQQLQQHLILSHGHNGRDTQENNSIEIETTTSVSEPTSINQTVEHNFIHAVDPSNNSEYESVPSLTIRTEDDGEPFSQNEDSNTIKHKSISKVGKSKPFKCETCGKCFLTFFELTQHRSEHVDDSRDTQTVTGSLLEASSDINHQVLSTGNQKNDHLMRHTRIRTDEGTYERNTGGEKITQRGNLTEHKIIHTEGKSYTCVVCGKYFTNESHLKKHKLIHTGEKPYKCEVCGKRFTENGTLSKHKLIHTGDKPYKCDLCGKRFVQNCNLMTHTRTHTGEKPFQCDVCGKGFAQNGGLAYHKLTHTGEKPHMCYFCGTYFARNSDLIAHIRTHTREKPYKCELCGKCFAVQFGLRVHKLVHTK